MTRSWGARTELVGGPIGWGGVEDENVPSTTGALEPPGTRGLGLNVTWTDRPVRWE